MIKRIIGFLTLLISLNMFAQKNSNSPYSFFGIGDYGKNKSVEEIGMGQIGGAFNSTYQLSFTNPASYASLRLTTFALAAQNNSLQIDDGTETDRASSASFSYLALGFPVGEKAGVTFGIQPNSTVGYSIVQEFRDNLGELETIDKYDGQGGTNRAFLGFGQKIGNNFSTGIELSYIFGNINNSLLNRRDDVPRATLQKEITNVTGITLKAGVQYTSQVSDKLKLTTGVALDLNNTLNNEGTRYLISTLNLPNPSASDHRDTTSVKDINIEITNPVKTVLSAGLGQDNKWYVGAEYSFQNALKTDDLLDLQNDFVGYSKANRISFGGFFTPKFNSITNYWQRVTYRAGLTYNQTGLVVNNNEINDFGISFGLGLPMSKQLSNINLSFELGTRGKASNDIVKENYFNFRLGLALSDKWFRKRKLD